MIGDKVRYYRIMQRLTQQELAEHCGWKSSGNISDVESRSTDVMVATAHKIAQALEVTIDDLIGPLTQDQREEIAAENRRIRVARAKAAYERKLEKQRRYRARNRARAAI